MLKSELMDSLKLVVEDMPVVIYCPTGDSILPLTSVLHDAPKTFLQTSGKKYYSTEKLLEKLQRLDSEIPFDAEVVSGDDWNYQVIISARLEDGAFLLTLSQPVFE